MIACCHVCLKSRTLLCHLVNLLLSTCFCHAFHDKEVVLYVNKNEKCVHKARAWDKKETSRQLRQQQKQWEASDVTSMLC